MGLEVFDTPFDVNFRPTDALMGWAQNRPPKVSTNPGSPHKPHAQEGYGSGTETWV